jgi:hypothetical protein
MREVVASERGTQERILKRSCRHLVSRTRVYHMPHPQWNLSGIWLPLSPSKNLGLRYYRHRPVLHCRLAVAVVLIVLRTVPHTWPPTSRLPSDVCSRGYVLAACALWRGRPDGLTSTCRSAHLSQAAVSVTMLAVSPSVVPTVPGRVYIKTFF